MLNCLGSVNCEHNSSYPCTIWCSRHVLYCFCTFEPLSSYPCTIWCSRHVLYCFCTFEPLVYKIELFDDSNEDAVSIGTSMRGINVTFSWALFKEQTDYRVNYMQKRIWGVMD